MKSLLIIAIGVLAVGCHQAEPPRPASPPGQETLIEKLEKMTPEERTRFAKEHPEAFGMTPPIPPNKSGTGQH